MKKTLIIAAILLAVFAVYLFVPKFSDDPVMSEKEKQVVMLKTYRKVFNMMKKDLGFFPKTGFGFDFIYKNMEGNQNWRGPYLGEKVDPVDVWGNNIIYRYPPKCGKIDAQYELYSTGKNGVDECLGGDDVYIN